MGVGSWESGIVAAVTAAQLLGAAAPAYSQVPQAAPAIGAAKDARANTEVAQQKNAEALPPSPAVPAPAAASQGAAPAGQSPAPAGQKPDPNAPPPPPGAGYTYDPAGRRDPFVSLSARGAELPAIAGQRPAGLAGLLIGEVTVKGTFKSRSGFLGFLQAPDGRTYTAKQGDKLFDGSIRAITADAVVFSQDVNDPLSLVKQREVRKSIRPEAR